MLALARLVPEWRVPVYAGEEIAAPLTAIVMILLAVRTIPVRRDQFSWYAMCLSAGSYCAGIVLWLIAGPRVPVPLTTYGLCIIGFSYLCLWVSLALRSGDFQRDLLSRLLVVIDLLITCGAAVAIGIYFSLFNLIQSPQTPAHLRIVLIALPIVGLITISSVLLMLLRTAPRLQHGPRALWVAGILGIVMADFFQIKTLTLGTTLPIALLENLRPLGYLAMGMAATWENAVCRDNPTRAREVDPFPALTGLVALISLMLLAFALTLSRSLRPSLEETGHLTTALTILSFLFALLLLRQIVTFLGNRRLYYSLHSLYTEVAYHAATDALTGVANQRSFMERFTREFRRTARYDHALAVIFADIDHFKQINDTYGHSAGDYALAEVARCLLDGVRETDLVARYGGEEFVILLPETNLRQAGHLAERLRRMVAALRLTSEEDATFRLTMSFGVAAYPETGNSIERLLHNADKAMYHAKHEGRNRVVQARRAPAEEEV